MVVIRAHFDGRVIIPDEPVQLTRDSQLIILVDEAESSKADATLEDATRRYYQERGPLEEAEDDAWGQATAEDSHKAWE